MLSVWSEVQTCIRPSWCHCHSLSLAAVKSRLILPFWYWLTPVVPDKGPLNGCVCACCSFEQFTKPGCINPDVQRQTIEALLASSNVPSSRFLRPEFIRLAPPLHTSDDEVLAHTHTHVFNGPFSGLPGWAGTRKLKPIWILLKQETVSGSGISWAICKSASRSRQITMPVLHHSKFFTGQMPFLSPNQQRQSTECTRCLHDSVIPIHSTHTRLT